MKDIQEELKKYDLIEEYPVQWGEMDAAKHVNNVIYMSWAESVRLAYFQLLGMDITFGKGVGPILGWQDCKYIFPMTYPDTVIVGVRTTEILEDRLIMECGMYSKKHNRIAAISKQTIIPYDYENLKKANIPNTWLEGVEKVRLKKI